MSLLSQIDTSASVQQPAQLLNLVYLTLQEPSTEPQHGFMSNHLQFNQHDSVDSQNNQQDEVSRLQILQLHFLCWFFLEILGKQ